MSAEVPSLARVVLGVDRVAGALARAAGLARDELLLSWLDPRAREAVTLWLYTRQGTYAPGGATYGKGLFEWERRALARPPFPAAGRVLLGAAGGGREIAGLRALGYEVLAFEPCEALARAAAAVAAETGAVFARGAYRDLIDAAAGRGALAGVLAGVRFDGVVLGWDSFSHVTSGAERRALLEALRVLAPGAPVLASFLRPRNVREGRLERLRPAVRALFAALGAPGAPGPGDAFSPQTGFTTGLDGAAFEALAEATGYAVAWSDFTGYPHAVLAPRAGAPRE